MLQDVSIRIVCVGFFTKCLRLWRNTYVIVRTNWICIWPSLAHGRHWSQDIPVLLSNYEVDISIMLYVIL